MTGGTDRFGDLLERVAQRPQVGAGLLLLAAAPSGGEDVICASPRQTWPGAHEVGMLAKSDPRNMTQSAGSENA